MEENTNIMEKNLTVYQRVALEGDICMAYETSLHKEDKEYNTFILCYALKEMSEYYDIYKDIMLEYVDEETFNKYYQYASQDIFPKALIVRKVLADINAYIGTGECLKDRIMTVPPRILKSKFTAYMRSISNVVPSTALDILNAIMQDDSGKLDFLKDLCFTMAMEINKTEDNSEDVISLIKLFTVHMLDVPALNFVTETKKLQSEDGSQVIDLGNMTVRITPDKDKEHSQSDRKYIVSKVDKSSGLVVFTKQFTDLDSASKYIKEIGETYPELLDRYKFKLD